MSTKQAFCILLLILAVRFILSSAINTELRTYAIFSENSTLVQMIEQQFMRWVNWIGTLKHSRFNPARNELTCQVTIVVDKRREVGNFNSVQAAVDSVEDFNTARVVIQINIGTYGEKVHIPRTKPFITFKGASASTTVIEWNDTAAMLGPDGKTVGTFNSATVSVDAPYFIAKNITFKNSAGAAPPAGSQGRQAVALRISGDNAAFLGCHFLGAQDTLYAHKGRHYFDECYVEGSVDFIFGDGLSMFKRCHMHAIGLRYGSVTAQKRTSNVEDTGFSFVNCKVTGSGLLYLGRAWGTFSRVVYSYTYMDDIIIPKGWYNWGDPTRDETVFFGQFRCYGPGADSKSRVAWSRELSEKEAQPFLNLSFIDGYEWIGLL